MRLRSLVLTVLTMGALSAGSTAVAQEWDARSMLIELARGFDRGGLEPDVSIAVAPGENRAAVRCATRNPSELERWLVDQVVAESAGRASRTGVAAVEIPVAFHVLRDKQGNFDVTDAAVDAQLSVLNAAYAGTGYSFRLQETRRYNNNGFAKKCHKQAKERRFKSKYAVDPASTLNVYTCRPADQTLGYAYLPSDLPEGSFWHGVVLMYSTLPGGGAVPYDEGDTLVHEVGHYLGLYHTFDPEPNGCQEPGDRVGDTPAEARPAYGCPVNRDTCTAASGVDPIENFMDYTDDACMDTLTAGQSQRMDEQVAAFKPTLLQAGSAR